MIQEDLRKQLQDASARYAAIAEQLRKEEAWVLARQSMFWQTIEADLRDAEAILKTACIAKGVTADQWRDDAAEARVYSRLLARPERAAMEVENLRNQLKPLEAEIRHLEIRVKSE